MPECQNCGSHVTERYVKVFTPTGVSLPRACPHCSDRVRARREVREARGTDG